MFTLRLPAVVLIALLCGDGPAQEKKAAKKKPDQYAKVELKGQLQEQVIFGGDAFWRLQFQAKGGGSLRMLVLVGEETWELALPDDQTIPRQAAKLIAKEVVVHGNLEPAPPGWSLPIFPPQAGAAPKHYIIRVTSLKAADAK